MSARNKRYSLLILTLLIAGAAVILTCSDKIVNSGDTDVVEFEMPLKFADGQESLAEVVTVFKVTIIADDDTIVANLNFSNGNITGLIENVPAGPDRLVIVEGLATDGTVIYRGTTVITVVAGQTVDAEITLLAVAKLVRVSPNFVDGTYGNSFVCNIRADNITGLTAISLALDYNSNVIDLDSVKAGADLPVGTNFSYNDEDGIDIQLSHSSSVVNSSGNAILAIAHFTPVLSDKCLDSTNLDLGIVTLTAPGVTLSDIYVDDGQAHISIGRLVVSQDTLKFGLGVPGLNLDFKKVDISDSCGDEIPYVVSTEETWIDLNTALAGITPGSIFIDIDTAGLASGKYEGRVRISSLKAINSPYEIVVKLDLDRGVRTLHVVPQLIYFTATENGNLPATRQIHVEEVYGYAASYSAAEDIPWLNINKTAGTTPDSVIVSITSTEVEPGTHIDTIVITSGEADNSPQYVTIRYIVGAVPKYLAVIPDTLYFSAIENDDPPPSQTFRVFETGGYSISFNASENVNWLNLGGVSGTTPDTVTVNINSTELSPQVYAGTITLLSDEADNSPQHVTVIYDLQIGPRVLATEPISLHFNMQQGGALPEPKTFLVFETGGHIINYFASAEASWFSISGVSGMAPDTVTVSITSSELGPGMYLDSIEITSNEIDNSPIYVVISLGVVAGPKTIEVEPDSLHFEYVQNSENYPTGQFRVFESDGYVIPYSAVENIDWLFLSQTNGLTEDTITVSTNPNLDPGLYVDSIMISSEAAENSPVHVKVYLEVLQAPRYLVADKDSLYLKYYQYSDAIPTGRFQVSELNGNQISFNAVKNVDWLSLNGISGMTPDDIDVSVDISLEPGVYVDSIVISSGEAENSPIFVLVTFEIVYMPPPALDVDPDTLYYTAQENGNLPDSQKFKVYQNNFPTPIVVTESIPWLYVTFDTGWVGTDVTVFISTTQLEPGVYFDSILVSAGELYVPAYEYIRYTVTPVIPTISGVVKDSDGQLLADVLVVAYDKFPDGTPLDSAFTDANGVFSFFEINGVVELYAFKDGYYPQTGSVTAPDTSVLISLTALSEFTPSDKWIDLYCDSSYFDSNLIQPNDVVEAFDPDGVLCGRFIVHTEGAYGFLHVYRDDETSPDVDEGCVTDDIITFKINGEITVQDFVVIYPSSYQFVEACLNVERDKLKWIVVLKPSGGETFYQDSTISVEWSSIGITGPVEILLTQSDQILIVLDTTDNDGQHGVKVPTGIDNSDNWRIQVRDLDEPVSGYSNLFTISSVELLVEPASLNFHGLLNDCVLDQKQFTVSEVNGFSIPFEVIDTVSWLTVSPSSGTTPAVVTVNILSNDLSLGVYESTLPITSNSAVNTPVSISIELEIGEYLCGDFNNDCRIKVGDLTNMVDYLYRGGTAPLFPDALNVDLCDGVDIADVDFLYSLIFDQAQSLCEGAAVCTEQSNDLGAPDSLGFIVAHAPSTQELTPRLQLDLYLFNDANTVNGLASGFGWDNFNMFLDSVRLSPVVEDSLSLNFVFEDDLMDSSNVNRHFLLAANKTIFSGISPAPVPQLLASYFFTLSSWTGADSIMVDTLTFNQGTTYKASTTNGAYRPVWPGPVIVKDQGF